MPADSAAIADERPTKGSATGLTGYKGGNSTAYSLPGKLRLVGLSDLDGRTNATKRARTLAAALKVELGDGLTIFQHAAAERAATLVALAEDIRSRRLAGDEKITLEDLVRVDAAADRALRRLNLKSGAPKQLEPDVDQYLATKREAEQ